MPEELDVGAVESGLENLFGTSAPEPKAPKPAAAPADEPAAQDAAADDSATPETDPAAVEIESTDEAAPLPEYAIEVDGETHTISDPEQIKELLQKGFHYTKNSQSNAANAQALAASREALIAQSKQLQDAMAFHQAAAQDMAQLRAIEQQLQQYEQVNLADLFERDFISAGKIKEQRDQLREARNAVMQQLNVKTATFQAGQAQAAQQIVAAEMAALQAKLPEMRDSTKAATLQKQIATALAEHYGISPAKLANLGYSEGDHALFLVARDAVAYRQLKASQESKLKQVRDAPPVIAPGAKSTNKGVSMAKAREALRDMGRKGNSRGQEALAIKMLDGAFN